VIDYRCSAGPADEAFVERHTEFSVSYVRTGGFGYRARVEAFELVAGSILVGYPGVEYVCKHDHVSGDECFVLSSRA
jgi:AraC family transcriptional regulator